MSYKGGHLEHLKIDVTYFCIKHHSVVSRRIYTQCLSTLLNPLPAEMTVTICLGLAVV